MKKITRNLTAPRGEFQMSRTVREMKKRISIKCIVAISVYYLIQTLPLAAQYEHVPVNHPVYNYFDRMHVKGILPEYSRAVLPVERKQTVAWLDTLESYRSTLTEAEIAILDRYRDEFVAEDRGAQSYVSFFSDDRSLDEMASGIFSDTQKFLYTWRDSSTRFFVEFLGSVEYRTVQASGSNSNVTLAQIGGRFRGTVKSFLGYSLQSTNGIEFGSRNFALTDRILRQNANFSDFGKKFFDFTEAYLSANFGWGKVVFGKERFLVGNGIGTKLIVSNNAPTFDALRFEVHYGSLRYVFAQGAVLSQKQMLPNGQNYYDPKYIALHRAQADFGDAVRFGVFESVIYAKRNIDLAYLNPINFYKSAEHANGDRDNPFLGFDLQTPWIDGLQFYGTWLIDDIDFSRWGTGWWGNKFAWQGGVTTTLLLPNTDVACEYTRIEPYTFSHFFPENAYTHKGYVIGSELDPNSDQWMIALRHWVNAKLFGTLRFQYLRHGDNFVNDEGVIRRNVGGDANVGFVMGKDNETVLFLDGDRTIRKTVSLNVRYEPFRNIVLDFLYRYDYRTAGVSKEKDGNHFLSLLLDVLF